MSNIDPKARTWAEIDMAALKHNFEIAKRTGKKVLCVIKANAYGHGAVPTARKLEELGAEYLAVACLEEGLELRQAGIQSPILILGATPEDCAEAAVEQDLTQTVFRESQARAVSQAARTLGRTAKVHLKVDTGMSRLGYLCDGSHFDGGVAGICEACGLPGLEAEGIFTHFAVADEQDQESQAYTRRQFDLFCRVIRAVEEMRGVRFPLRHCANTGATACYPEMHLDMVRPGLLLYGYGEFAQRLDLRPVMTLKTTISTTKTYEPGTSVSYGRLFTMGVVPYGYADGFFRCLSDRCSLMTAKGPAPQRGRICMDMSMIDLTDLPGVDVGDEVEIFGPRNPVEVMAAQAGTIPYELTCAVSKRVPRVYLQNGQVTERELLLRF